MSKIKLEVGELHIDKYKQPDGRYEDPDGCSYDTAEDFMQCYVIGQCGCGDPTSNVKYVGKMLAYVHDLKQSVWSKDISYEEWQEKGRDLGTHSSIQFMFYWLDEKGFTEHGGSIPGWLTDEGLELLEDIKAMYYQL
jgi:hypothetical protein